VKLLSVIMIGIRWIPLRRRDFTQFHNYPRYRLTVVWTVSAGVVISLEITPAKLSPRLLEILFCSEPVFTTAGD